MSQVIHVCREKIKKNLEGILLFSSDYLYLITCIYMYYLITLLLFTKYFIYIHRFIIHTIIIHIILTNMSKYL